MGVQRLMKFKLFILASLIFLMLPLKVKAEGKAIRVLNQQEDFSITASKLEELDLDFAKIKTLDSSTTERLRVAFDLLGKSNTDSPLYFLDQWCAYTQKKICEIAGMSNYPNSNAVTNWIDYLSQNGEVFKLSSSKKFMPNGVIYNDNVIFELNDYDYVKPGDYLFHKQSADTGDSHILLCVYRDNDVVVTIDGNGGSAYIGNEAEKEAAYNYLKRELNISLGYTYEEFRNFKNIGNGLYNRVWFKVFKIGNNFGELYIKQKNSNYYISHVGRFN